MDKFDYDGIAPLGFNLLNGLGTPLHDAAYMGRLELVQVLLEGGASKDIKDTAGQLPYEVARRWGHKEVVSPMSGGG